MGHTILVVAEDQLRVLLSVILQQRGYRVLEAKGAEQAKRLADDNKVSFLLVDADISCARIVGVPTMYMTSSWKDELVGAYVIEKPFKLKDLIARVESLMAVADECQVVDRGSQHGIP